MGNLLSGAQGAFKNAGGVEGLMENPMFNVGMGLLQANNANYGQDSNPYAAALGGLQQTQRNRDLGDERDALKKARENQDELQKRLQELYGGAQVPQGPQMSPVPQTDPFAQLGSGWGGGQAPWQTPGINPNAPPMGGVPQSPFGPAPTSAPAQVGASVPNSEQIGALMLQYGNPAQQQAALSNMSAGERFTRGLAAEETRYRRKQENGQGQIGNVTPSNYTPESIEKYQQSRDFSDLVRYERLRQVDVGGVKYNVDAVTGQTLGPVGGGVNEAVSNRTAINRAGAEGTAQGTAITAAQQGVAELQTVEDQLTALMDDKNFGQAVGKLDAVTGRVGEWFGSDQGVLGGEVQRVSNALVTQAVKNWKGAISERELEFFLNGVPGRGSSEQTWRHWMENEYLPRKRLMERVASGEVFHDDRLAGGSSSTANFENTVDQATADALAQYGVGR